MQDVLRNEVDCLLMGETLWRNEWRVAWISGPVVKAIGSLQVSMLELVEEGEERLVGEIIGLAGETITIQVYEEPPVSIQEHLFLAPDCRFRWNWGRGC